MVYSKNCSGDFAGSASLICVPLVILVQNQPREPQEQQIEQPTTLKKSKVRMFKVIGIITIIIVALAILATLFIFFPESDKEIETTPKGSLSFIESTTVPGKYYGDFGGVVKNKDIKITLFDVSLGQTVTMNKPNDGDIVQIPNGCNLTYYDYNHNDKLDGADWLIVHEGDPGDEITVIFKPTGEIIAETSLR